MDRTENGKRVMLQEPTGRKDGALDQSSDDAAEEEQDPSFPTIRGSLVMRLEWSLVDNFQLLRRYRFSMPFIRLPPGRMCAKVFNELAFEALLIPLHPKIQ